VYATDIVGVGYRAIIIAESDSFSSETFVITNAQGMILVQFGWNGYQGIPVFYRPHLTDVTVTGGLLKGLNNS
jgi:hypothetical protein